VSLSDSIVILSFRIYQLCHVKQIDIIIIIIIILHLLNIVCHPVVVVVEEISSRHRSQESQNRTRD